MGAFSQNLFFFISEIRVENKEQNINYGYAVKAEKKTLKKSDRRHSCSVQTNKIKAQAAVYTALL